MTDLAFSFPLESQPIWPRTVTGSFQRQVKTQKSTLKSSAFEAKQDSKQATMQNDWLQGLEVP